MFVCWYMWLQSLFLKECFVFSQHVISVMVTVSVGHVINLLKPTGYVMHQQV
jgi:hypothetical protein